MQNKSIGTHMVGGSRICPLYRFCLFIIVKMEYVFRVKLSDMYEKKRRTGMLILGLHDGRFK